MPQTETIQPPALTLTWSDWKPLRQKGEGEPPGAPARPGVYEIRCRLEPSLSQPEVVYIGRSTRGATGLKGRIDNHRTRPGQVADNLVNRCRFWDHALQPVEVRWAVTSDAHYAEAVLLRVFRDRNGQLPRFNTEG